MRSSFKVQKKKKKLQPTFSPRFLTETLTREEKWKDLKRSTPDAGTPGAPADGEGGPAAPAPNLTSNRRLQQTQAQVDEVVDIMRVNVDKVLERDQKLSELDDRADALQAGPRIREQRRQTQEQYWWKKLQASTFIHPFIHPSSAANPFLSLLRLIRLRPSWNRQSRLVSSNQELPLRELEED
ncbi:hypothetical protein INR49_002481 [Caranx melampygus]|nr:hypothetical protein INR49_002481 [Caranx melampygus]